LFRVRNYVRKKPPPKYTVMAVQEAVRAMKSGTYTYKQASEEFKVPISVIFQRIKGRMTQINCITVSRSKTLSDECEELI